MPRQRSKKLSSSRVADGKPAPKVEWGSEPEDSDNASPDISEMDEDEEQLERLVLGDGATFKAQLSMDMDVDEEDLEEDGTEEGLEAEVGLENVDDADLFFLDAGPTSVDPQLLLPQDGQDDGNAPAWEDSDDERLVVALAGNTRLRKLRVNEAEDVVNGKEYTKRLRRQFELLNPVPEWALQSSRPAKRRRRSLAGSDSSISSNDMDMDSDDVDLSALPIARFLQDAGSLVRTPQAPGKRSKLRPEVLDIQRTRAIPSTQASAITSLSFHPQYPLLLSSGPASTLYLHHIAPTAHPIPNPLLTSVHVRNTPIATSAFLFHKGDKVYFGGRRRFFHTWDLNTGIIQKTTRVYGHKEEQKSMERFKLSPCGRYMALIGSSKKGGGTINILDASTTQWIAAARIEGKNGVADFAWWSDGSGLTVVGKGGEVGEYNMESRSFVGRWVDDGSIGATVLSLGGNNGPTAIGGDRWVVIGSQSGVVNIYDRRNFVSGTEIKIKQRPEPNRRFDQLTTPTSNMQISPDGQLLAFSSKWKKDALRLVHLPSCTVYRNWPTSSTPLGKITAVAFGIDSDLLAVANEAGKIRLWDIRS